MTADFVRTEEAVAMAQPEESLLEAAVRNHARMVYRIAYSVLHNAMDAEDAVQETFLRALGYEKKMHCIRDQKAWLARIAWRVAVERRKRLTVARTEEVGDGVPSQEQAADLHLLEKERRQFLEQLIAALPDPLRDPLVLSTLEELKPREVATMLGLSEAAVRSRAFRARQILRERLDRWMGVKT